MDRCATISVRLRCAWSGTSENRVFVLRHRSVIRHQSLSSESLRPGIQAFRDSRDGASHLFLQKEKRLPIDELQFRDMHMDDSRQQLGLSHREGDPAPMVSEFIT